MGSIPAASTNKQPSPHSGAGFLLVEIGMNQAQSGFSRATQWRDNAGAQRRRSRRGEDEGRIIPAASTNKQPSPHSGGGFLLVEIGSTRTPPRKFSLEKAVRKFPFT
jgi:hypothetical protein